MARVFIVALCGLALNAAASQMDNRIYADACIKALAKAGRPVVTRFAPSPTGALHIGGARTALLNALYARHHGGKYLLRIEDTDLERSKPEHVDGILKSLRTLGLDAEGTPLIQSERAPRHREVVNQLLARGQAYFCYVTPEQLEEYRKRLVRWVSPWRDDPTLAPAPGVLPAVRLRAEHTGQTSFRDLVQGSIRFENKLLDDMVLLRSDGSPTYMLSVVVDDHDMDVTHVIRGVDHLSNTARQLQIYRAMGWEPPTFAHVALIHDDEGKKLSKRKNAVGVGDYLAQGILPEALVNYLARLGWGHGDDEVFTLAEAERWFDVKKVRPSPSRLDMGKLRFINRAHLRRLGAADLRTRLRAYLPAAEVAAIDQARGWTGLERLLPELQTRVSTLDELRARAEFLWRAPAPKPADPDDVARLKNLRSWNSTSLRSTTRTLSDPRAVRIALTGADRGVPLSLVLDVLGRDEVLRRLAR